MLLIFDKALCKRMVDYAEANPIDFVDIQAAAIGVQPIDFTPYTQPFPPHAVVGFTVEEQEDGRYLRHFSVKPPVPPLAVGLILMDFGVDWDMEERRGKDPCIDATVGDDAVDLYFEHPNYKPPGD